MEEKLFLSIYESLRHRPTALPDAINLTKTVIQRINQSAKHGVIDAKLISKVTLVCLNRFDKVASTHYQAFHDL
jgi:transcriptional regulator NrdR family protein